MDAKTILGETKFVTVGIDDTERVILELNHVSQENINGPLTNSFGHVLANCEYLASLCAENLRGKSRREAARWLGTALVRTFVDLENNNQGTHDLDKAEQFIREQLRQQARVIYVFSTFAFALMYAGLLLWLNAIFKYDDHPTIKPMSLGCLGACLGTFISILQRNHVLNVDPLSSRTLIISQGAIRVTLGLLSGAVIAMLVKSKLLFGIDVPDTGGTPAWDNFKALLVTLGIVSGFSERLIPELLQRLEGSVLSQVTSDSDTHTAS